MKEKNRKWILVICNIFLILAMISASLFYFGYISKSQTEIKRAGFVRTIESMKQVSQNYLDSEQGYVSNWATYISDQNMDMEEALDFLRSINTNKERFVHIVDMDSYEAYSSYYPKGEEKIDTYLSYKEQKTEDGLPFGSIMESMFAGENDGFQLLGKYRLTETQTMAVGIGTRVTLRTENGKKDYLLLRIIPLDELKKIWIFPTEYSSAEVGIITRSGDYVVQSASMRSQNFVEYIRGYNFQDNYNAGENLRNILREEESGILKYKNFKGTDCEWYYSSFSNDSELDILGVMDADELKPSSGAWYIILIVCGSLLILMVIDGAYLINMNHRLREAARLSEQANRAKTRFLSAMSHDIRTPLNAVLGMMTLAKNRSEDAAYVEKCMDKGLQSGKHLLTLISDVLDISKIESGKITLNPDQISLEELMQELLEMQEQSLKIKNIELQSTLDIFPYRYVYADGMRLNQIYVNLLTNAVKYTKSGGKIELHLYEKEIPGKPEYIQVIFYLKDNGIGMTEEFQKNMYRNFTREINTEVNSIQGSGLGLSIVKQMVDLMGGTITCESVPDQGTAFTVSVELLAAKEIQKAAVDEKEIEDIKNMHLLVAEDNELNWEILHEMVSMQEIICDHAENGKECVEMLKKAPTGTYAAILMDINMPMMNGYEATREIRSMEEEEKRNIPIIAMTADAFAEDVQACKACGMNGHIAKPINMEILFSWLEKIQNGKI